MISKDIPDNSISVNYSDIHGFGLFALKYIPQRRLISVISGEIISLDEAMRREIEENNVFIFWNDRHCIDTILSDKIKYINHHCSPNCSVEDYNENYLALYSLRDIHPNEEITIDYGYDEIYESCRCSHCIQA